VTLRVGFLGYGFMGTAHANALARLPMFFPDAPETERAILIGRDVAALATAADRLGFAETRTDWRDVIDDVDVLYNLGPNHLHADPSIAALQADTHVLCEKPLAHDHAAADRMATAARESDARAAIGFVYRYVPALQLAKSLVDDGTIGEVREVRVQYLQDWLRDPEAPWSWRLDADLAGSGALGDLGSHAFDLLRWLVGDLAAVSGHRRTFVDERPDPAGDGRLPVTVDDAVSAQVRFEGGAMGTVEASRVAAGHKNDLRIAVHGSRGSLRFGLERLNELGVCGPEDRGYERVLVTDPDDPYVDAWWPPGHALGWEHAFVHQSYEFLDAVASDAPYRPTFQDGLAVQQALGAVAESDATGGWHAVD